MNIYEIHVSVDIKSGWEEAKWIQYCNQHNYQPIHVVNLKGKYDRQYMMSEWCQRKDEYHAVERAKSISRDISKYFTVLRTKVEGMMLCEKYKAVDVSSSGRYWEFHAKIIAKSDDVLDRLTHFYNLKRKEDNIWKCVGISMSIYSQTKCPIITIRLSEGDVKNAMKVKDAILADLKTNGFHIKDKIQRELSIYDDNVEQDVGWIN